MRGRSLIGAAAALLVACGGGGSSGDGAVDSSVTNDSSPAIDTGVATDAPKTDTSIADTDAVADAVADADTDDAPTGDLDLDGLADADESKWASDYFPYLSIHPSDGCPVHGILDRVSPHPTESGRVMIWYDVLYNDDCGASGHIGDDEVFGVVIDPKKPAPDGILAVRAISHQGTPCEHTTTCGQCSDLTACGTATRAGKSYPVVYPSKDKHGNYADKPTCDGSFICDFGGCALSAAADAPPFVNAGEPSHPLVHDLTTEGFVTTTNGWTHPELMDFDPWKPGNFGGAGDISKDLVDTSFVVDTTKCP